MQDESKMLEREILEIFLTGLIPKLRENASLLGITELEHLVLKLDTSQFLFKTFKSPQGISEHNSKKIFYYKSSKINNRQLFCTYHQSATHNTEDCRK